MLVNILIVGIGGFLGAILRYGLVLIFNTNTFSYGILIANSLGSFLAGIFFVLISEKLQLSDAYKLALIIGLCGSLTTLSTISLESVNLWLENNYYQSIINLVSNMVLSVLCIILGIFVAKYV